MNTTRPSFLDILDQDELWWTASGAPIRLADMGPRHRRNTLAFIRRAAAGIKFTYELSALSGPLPTPGSAAADCFDSGIEQLVQQDDQAWLNEQPLVARLRQLVDADHTAGVPDEPDERIGKPLPCASWCAICAEHGPITEPGAPYPCTSCHDCTPALAAANDSTGD